MDPGTPCAISLCPEHQRLWELRQVGGAYTLYCPRCACVVSNRKAHPNDAPMRASPAPANPRGPARRCVSCNRELPQLSVPMIPQRFCAFCRNHMRPHWKASASALK